LIASRTKKEAEKYLKTQKNDKNMVECGVT